MRARTYGRKKRARAEITFSLDSSSPMKVQPLIEQPMIETAVLLEKSPNARPKTPQVIVKTSTPISAENDPIEQLIEHTAELSICTSDVRTRSTRSVCEYREPLPTSHKPSRSIRSHDAAISSPFARTPQIQQRPANVSKDTLDYLTPLLSTNISQCVEDFQGWADERAAILRISKVGEGSFGEVYRAQGSKEAVILKLMPLNAQKGKGSRSYTSIESASNEISLLKRMQRVPGFVEYRGACILQGTMASQFTSFWNEYMRSSRTVESKDPNKKATYPDSQLWLLIEMSDAGRNLERGQYLPPDCPLAPPKGKPYLSIQRTWDIWWQVVKALAKAEVFCEFEHRDMHLGNICIKDLHPSRDLDSMEKREYQSDPYGINKSGTQVTLIDYSLSRANFGNGKEFFYDFQKDKNLLNGEGDLQYDMYRYMAEAVGDSSCRDFHPKTNVVWLYFVLRLLLQATNSPGTSAAKKNRLMTTGEQMKVILQDIKKSIDPKDLSMWNLNSAADLLDVGVGNSWFLPEDIVEV